jgi:hypothetical protein
LFGYRLQIAWPSRFEMRTCHAAREIHMQTLVRIVVAFAVVVLLLLVVLPIQLISMLVENEPKYEPGNESRRADDLESEPESISPLEPPPHSRP